MYKFTGFTQKANDVLNAVQSQNVQVAAGAQEPDPLDLDFRNL